MPEPGADPRRARLEVDIEQAGIAFAAGAGQHRALMRLVELLVGRKTYVPIDAENAAIGVADKRDAGRIERIAQRRQQGAERPQHLGIG